MAIYVDYLIVAGGGGLTSGSSGFNAVGLGGSGGGGVVASTSLLKLTTSSYSIVVGAAGGINAYGGNSSAFGATANGGASWNGQYGQAGGCGSGGGGSFGGGSGAPPNVGGGSTQISYPSVNGRGYGNAGGNGRESASEPRGGGGGGAGAAGGNATASLAGAGGNGFLSSITGSNVYYGGGGGGGNTSGAGGTMGLGSGVGSYGGGGSVGFGIGDEKSATPGIVIIRTNINDRFTVTGNPTITTVDTYRIYSFTANGSITPLGVFIDSDNIDLLDKYVTKEYAMNWYPDLLPNMLTPQLFTWGYNISGGLGNGTATNRSSPGTTAAGGTNWKQVDGGINHMTAIKTDGTLWSWGSNNAGQLGDNSLADKSSPVTTIVGGTTWKQASNGWNHTTAVKTDGTLWTWGFNIAGQLGDNTTTDRLTPGTTAIGGTNWKQVACGRYHNAAVKTDGTLWTWGQNTYGKLGDGTIINRSIPVATIGGGTNWKQASCGENHSAAIKTDGILCTWGSDFYGELGINQSAGTSSTSPVTVSGSGNSWKQVSCGMKHTTAIKTDSTLWAWGENGFGAIGNNSTVSALSPVTTTGGGTNWKQVSGGAYYTTAVKTDGTLWTWGLNDLGQLGTGAGGSRRTPGTTAGGGTNWKQVSGWQSTAAISESEGW